MPLPLIAAKQAWQAMQTSRKALAHFHALPTAEQERLRETADQVRALVGELALKTRNSALLSASTADQPTRDLRVVTAELQSAVAILTGAAAHEVAEVSESRRGRYAAKAVARGASRLGEERAGASSLQPPQRVAAASREAKPAMAHEPQPSAQSASQFIADELAKLTALRERGELADDEFAQLAAQLTSPDASSQAAQRPRDALQAHAAERTPDQPDMAVIDELMGLARLLRTGALDATEFQQARARLLDSAAPSGTGIDPHLRENLHALAACTPYDDGVAQDQLGNHLAACEHFFRAVASAHSEVSANAAFNLGSLLLEFDDPQGARTAWRIAMAFGTGDGSCRAAFNLGNLLRAQREWDEAERAYRFVIDAGHEDADKASAKLHALSQHRTTPGEPVHDRGVSDDHILGKDLLRHVRHLQASRSPAQAIISGVSGTGTPDKDHLKDFAREWAQRNSAVVASGSDGAWYGVTDTVLGLSTFGLKRSAWRLCLRADGTPHAERYDGPTSDLPPEVRPT